MFFLLYFDKDQHLNFLYLFSVMKFYEKYPELKDKIFLTQILINTVYSTMALEDQEVPMPKVKEIVSELLNEQALEGNQFFSN